MGVRNLWPLIKAVGSIFTVGRFQSWREAGVLLSAALKQSGTSLFLVDTSSVLGNLHATRLTRLLDRDRLGQQLEREQEALVVESTEALADLVRGIRSLCPATNIHLVFDGPDRLVPKEEEIKTRDKSRLTLLLDELLHRARRAAGKGKRHIPSARRLLAAFGILWDVEGERMHVASNLDELSGFKTICGLQRVTAEDIDKLNTDASRYVIESCTLVTATSDADWHIASSTRRAVSPSSSATPAEPVRTGVLTAAEHLAALDTISLAAGAVATASNDGDIVTGSGSSFSTIHVRLQSHQVEVVDRRLFEQRLGLDAGGVAAANLSLTLGQDFVGSGVQQIGLEAVRRMPPSLAAWIQPDWLRLDSVAAATSVDEVWSTASARLASELRGVAPTAPWLAELRAFCGASPAPPSVDRRALSMKVWEELLRQRFRSTTPLADPPAPRPASSSAASPRRSTPLADPPAPQPASSSAASARCSTPQTSTSTSPQTTSVSAVPPRPPRPPFSRASPSNPRHVVHNLALPPGSSPQKPHERVAESPKLPRPFMRRPTHPLIQTRIYPHAPTLFQQFSSLPRPLGRDSDAPPPKKKQRTRIRPLKGQTVAQLEAAAREASGEDAASAPAGAGAGANTPAAIKGGYPLRLSCPLRTRNLSLESVFLDTGMQQLASFVRNTFGSVLPIYLSCLATQIRLQRRLANPLSPGVLNMAVKPEAFADVLERVALFSLGGSRARAERYRLSTEETLFQDLGVRSLFGQANWAGEVDGTPDTQTKLLVQAWRRERVEIQQVLVSHGLLLSDYRAAQYTSSLFLVPDPIKALLLSPPGRSILSDLSTTLAVNIWNRQQAVQLNFRRVVLSWLSKPLETLASIRGVDQLVAEGLPPGFRAVASELAPQEKSSIASVAATIAQQPRLAARLANAVAADLADSTEIGTVDTQERGSLPLQLTNLEDELISALETVGITTSTLAASLNILRRALAGLMARGVAADAIDLYARSTQLDPPHSLDRRHASLAILLGRGTPGSSGPPSGWTLEECLGTAYGRLQAVQAEEGQTPQGRRRGSVAAGLEGEVAGVRSTTLACVLELVVDSIGSCEPIFGVNGMIMLPRYIPIGAPQLASLAYAAATSDIDVPQLAATFRQYLSQLARQLEQRGLPVDLRRKIGVFLAEHGAALRDVAQATPDLSHIADNIHELVKASLPEFTPRQLVDALSSRQIAALAALAPTVATATRQIPHGRLALGSCRVGITVIRLDQAPTSARTRLLGKAAQSATVKHLIEAAARDGEGAEAFLTGLTRLPAYERSASATSVRTARSNILQTDIFRHLPASVLGRKLSTSEPRSLAKPPIPQLPAVPSSSWPSTIARIRRHLGLHADGSGSPVKGAVLVSIDPGAKVAVDAQSEVIGEAGSVRVARARDAVFLQLQRKLQGEREAELTGLRERGAVEEELATASSRLSEKEKRILRYFEDQVAQQLVDWLVPPSHTTRPVVLAIGDGMLGAYTGQRGAKVAFRILKRMIDVAEDRKDIELLVVAVPEAYTSSLCMRLACRQMFATKLVKYRFRSRKTSFPFQRILHCPHDGLTAHRDDVGAANVGSNLVSLALFGVTALSKAFAEMFGFPWFS